MKTPTEALSFKHIRVEHEHRSVDFWLTLIRKGTIVIKNSRFGKETTWNALEMSRYIESIWLRLPLQPLYFDRVMPQWLVIDGYQRLRTLKHFIIHTELAFKEVYAVDFPNEQVPEPLKLEGLQFFTQWNGHTFDQLPLSWRRRILEGIILGYVQSSEADHTVRQAIFELFQPSIDTQRAFFVSQVESINRLLTLFAYHTSINLEMSLNEFSTYEITLQGLSFLCFPYQEHTQDSPFLMDTLYKLSRMPRPQLRKLLEEWQSRLQKIKVLQ